MSAEADRLFRLRQESNRGKVFVYKKWKRLADNWTHDHCDMCMIQIREEVDHEVCNDGYVTYTPDEGPERIPVSANGYIAIPAPWEPEGNATWICPKCFLRHRDEFGWKSDDGGACDRIPSEEPPP